MNGHNPTALRAGMIAGVVVKTLSRDAVRAR
jgi:hypothetical protein